MQRGWQLNLDFHKWVSKYYFNDLIINYKNILNDNVDIPYFAGLMPVCLNLGDGGNPHSDAYVYEVKYWGFAIKKKKIKYWSFAPQK